MIEVPHTLMAMLGAPAHPAPLDRASLVLIDFQEEYRLGALPLPGVEQALTVAASMLRLAREHGVPVFHIMHETAPGAPVFDPTGPMAAIMPAVAPREGEAVVAKTRPNAFAATDLHAKLKATGREELIVIGLMTHMCLSSTVRAALDLGYRSTVVAAACATRDLPRLGSGVVKASELHRTALAELADAFAVVVEDADAWR